MLPTIVFWCFPQWTHFQLSPVVPENKKRHQVSAAGLVPGLQGLGTKTGYAAKLCWGHMVG
jgi:hypothetical protein